MMYDRDLYMRAFEKWGKLSQMDMAIEECAELTRALLHYRRKMGDGVVDRAFAVCEEVADVEIMMEQLREMFSGPVIDKIKEFKLRRLRERLETEEGHGRTDISPGVSESHQQSGADRPVDGMVVPDDPAPLVHDGGTHHFMEEQACNESDLGRTENGSPDSHARGLQRAE